MSDTDTNVYNIKFITQYLQRSRVYNNKLSAAVDAKLKQAKLS